MFTRAHAKEPHMSSPFVTRIASFALAALVTTTLLGSMRLMAAEQQAAAQMAHEAASRAAHQQLAASVSCRNEG
jgi:hypothetical protein